MAEPRFNFSRALSLGTHALKWVFWLLAFLVFILTALVATWSITSSGYYLRILDMTYDTNTKTITLTREVIAEQDVLARWYMNVQISGTRIECADTNISIYEPYYMDGTPKREVSFMAGPLTPCLEAPEVEIVASWQVLLFGWLPLKPTYFFKPPRI